MKVQERKNLILESVKMRGHVSIKELSQLCKVSPNTMRSDIEILCQEGLIVKYHGGVTIPLVSASAGPPEIVIRQSYKNIEKKAIAKLVAQMLPKYRDISVFFDSSTTSLEVALALDHHAAKITAITNFANIAEILWKNPRNAVYFCGGRWLGYENSTIGEEAVLSLSKHSVDYAILGCTGLSREKGVFNGTYDTLSVKQAMKAHARETWIVCDNEKFDKEDLISMFPVEEITLICTNAPVSEQWVKYCEDKKIKLLWPTRRS